MRLEVSSNVEQEDNAFLGQRVKFPASVDAPSGAPWSPNQLNIREAESADDGTGDKGHSSFPRQALNIGLGQHSESRYNRHLLFSGTSLLNSCPVLCHVRSTGSDRESFKRQQAAFSRKVEIKP